MGQSACRSLWLASIAALWAATGAAAGEDDPGSFAAFYLGASLSSEQQYSVEAAYDIGFANNIWTGMSLVHADSDDTEVLSDARTSAIDLSFGLSRKRWQYSAGASYIEDEGLGDTRQLRLAAGHEFGAFTGRLAMEWREARYELQNFDALLRSLDALLEEQLQQQLQERFPQVDFTDLLSLNAELDIESLSYSVELNYEFSDTFRLFAGASVVDYRQPPDRVSLSAGLNRFGDTERGQQVLARINQALVGSLDGLASDFRSGFYDHGAHIGVDFDSGSHNWLFEISQDKDTITGEFIRGLALQWIMPLGLASDLRVAVTSRHADRIGTVNHVGLGVFFYH